MVVVAVHTSAVLGATHSGFVALAVPLHAVRLLAVTATVMDLANNCTDDGGSRGRGDRVRERVKGGGDHERRERAAGGEERGRGRRDGG